MTKNPRLARTLAITCFLVSSGISAWTFLTEETLDAVDYAFIVLFPAAFATVAYFVGLSHDPSASE
jgi:hypothetical protein